MKGTNIRTEWMLFGIDTKTNYDGAGVYQILLFKNEKPVPIHRLVGIDTEGVLAIGHTENIENRRKQFRRSSEEAERGHSEGIQWWLAKSFHKQSFEGSQIRFKYVKLGSKSEAKKEEERQIKAYFEKHCEAPPLNGSIPKRIEWFEELRSTGHYK
jgi:hypothetical protein